MEVFMLFVGLGVPAGLVITLSWFRLTERLRLQEVVRAAAEAQQPLSAAAIRALSGSYTQPPRERDRRRGVMLLAAGGSLLLFGLLANAGLAAGNAEVATAVGVILAALGVIPFCLGAGYVFLSRREPDAAED